MYSDIEIQALRKLESELRRVEEWPSDSPLAFVVHLAPRTRGTLGEKLVSAVAAMAGVKTTPSGSAEFDRYVSRRAGDDRVEVKFSTEDPPRFQQIRDPRRDGFHKYDYLLCVSGRPDSILYWIISAADVARMVDEGIIYQQHQDSTTNWCFPSRTEADDLASYRGDASMLVRWLRG